MNEVQSDYGVVEINGDIYSKNKTLNAYSKDSINYEFDSWNGDVSSNDNPITVTCIRSKTTKIIAKFKKIVQYYLNAICDSSKGLVRVEKTSIKNVKKAHAIALDGYVFDHWDGVDASQSQQNPLTYTFNDDIDHKKTIVAIFNIDPSKTCIYKSSSEDPIVIDSTILDANIIGRRSFSIEDYTILRVTLGNKVTNISEKCFMNCKNLLTIEIPEDSKLTAIGQLAFSKSGIEHLDLSKTTIKEIENETFSECANLTSLLLNSGTIERISYAAFQKCTKLKTVVNTSNEIKTSVGRYAFDQCKSLESIIIVNDKKTNKTIDEYAFSNCDKLKTIDLRQFKTDADMLFLPEIADASFGGAGSISERKFVFESKTLAKLAYGKYGWNFYGREFQPLPFDDRPTQIKVTATSSKKKLSFQFGKNEHPSIDWGNGDITNKSSYTYSKAGTYTVSIQDKI